MAIRSSPGSSRSITSPRETRSQRHSSAGRSSSSLTCASSTASRARRSTSSYRLSCSSSAWTSQLPPTASTDGTARYSAALAWSDAAGGDEAHVRIGRAHRTRNATPPTVAAGNTFSVRTPSARARSISVGVATPGKKGSPSAAAAADDLLVRAGCDGELRARLDTPPPPAPRRAPCPRPRAGPPPRDAPQCLRRGRATERDLQTREPTGDERPRHAAPPDRRRRESRPATRGASPAGARPPASASAVAAPWRTLTIHYDTSPRSRSSSSSRSRGGMCSAAARTRPAAKPGSAPASSASSTARTSPRRSASSARCARDAFLAGELRQGRVVAQREDERLA